MSRPQFYGACFLILLLLAHGVSCKGGTKKSKSKSSRSYSKTKHKTVIYTGGGGGYHRYHHRDGHPPANALEVALVVIAIIIFAAVVGWLIYGKCKKECRHKHYGSIDSDDSWRPRVSREVVHKAYDRLSRKSETGVFTPLGATIPQSGRYVGRYMEGGELKLSNYELSFSPKGKIKGKTGDADGLFDVRGYWTNGACYWAETHPCALYSSIKHPQDYADKVSTTHHLHVEVELRQSLSNPMKMEGRYCASTGIGGDLELWYDGMGNLPLSSFSDSENEEYRQSAPPLV